MSPLPPHTTQGTLHSIPPSLSAFEPLKPLTRNLNINTLIWIGGLFDSPGSVMYPFTLADALPHTWSLVIANLSSSGHSWGTSSISNDAREISKLAAFFQSRRPGGKVVIMGHSTGCQDCMEYLIGNNKRNDGEKEEERSKVDGAIFQAPVSDREALDMFVEKDIRKAADDLAVQMCARGEEKEFMPYRLTKNAFGRCALTARRWVDISSPPPDHQGGEDFFSSDLDVERLKGTFGSMKPETPICVLVSGKDEGMPETIDKEGLVRKWTGVVKEGRGVIDEEASGVVDGASHNLNGDPEEVVNDLVSRVVGFIGRLDKGVLGSDGGDGVGSRI